MRGFVRGVLIFFIGAVVGTIIGLTAGLIIFPYVFAPPPATEQQGVSDTRPIASGTFIHADPSDPFHRGQGGVTLYEQAVFLEKDFEVAPGPDFHVYLSKSSADAIRNADDNNALAEQGLGPDLGQLRSFQGSQRFPVPAGENLCPYTSVTVWCQTFEVLVTVADLKEAGS